MKLPMNYNKISIKMRKQVREQYIKIQNSKCWYCSESLYGPAKQQILNKYIDKSLFPEGFFNYPIHLHHDHITGLTIGAVHCHCNAVLWQYEHK